MLKAPTEPEANMTARRQVKDKKENLCLFGSPACPRRCVRSPLPALHGERSKRNGEERGLAESVQRRAERGKPGWGRIVPTSHIGRVVVDKC